MYTPQQHSQASRSQALDWLPLLAQKLCTPSGWGQYTPCRRRQQDVKRTWLRSELSWQKAVAYNGPAHGVERINTSCLPVQMPRRQFVQNDVHEANPQQLGGCDSDGCRIRYAAGNTYCSLFTTTQFYCTQLLEQRRQGHNREQYCLVTPALTPGAAAHLLSLTPQLHQKGANVQNEQTAILYGTA